MLVPQLCGRDPGWFSVTTIGIITVEAAVEAAGMGADSRRESVVRGVEEGGAERAEKVVQRKSK